MTDLGTLGGSASFAYGINAAGQVVGWSHMPGDAAIHGFLYSGGAMTDLNLLPEVAAFGFSSLAAYGLNDSGQITGYGWIGGQYHAFLLTPVPEPETYAMFLAGLGLMGAVAKRRRARA